MIFALLFAGGVLLQVYVMFLYPLLLGWHASR